MSQTPEIPQLPSTQAIELDRSLKADTEDWFTYAIKAYPYHTDYAGVVWHGSYITWMEEARIEYLRSLGIDFADLVVLGCDLPVVDLSVRYHQPLRMGMEALLKTRLVPMEGVRMDWEYQIVSLSGEELYLTAKVTLVAVDREKGKIMRQLPPAVKDVLVKLYDRGL
jgi:acyl-CoA thioester hydrolase